MKWNKFIAAASLFGLAASAMAQSVPLDPAVRTGKLSNGLTYYIRKNAFPKGQADFYIAQKVGSIQEEDNQRGLAHFLEHMCFNGTEHFPGNTLIRYLEGLGVKFGEQLNAYTSVERTVYNINNVPTARATAVDSVLLILSDWSHGLTLSSEEIDKERAVIHEEWRMSNRAMTRIYTRVLPLLMPNTRYAYRLPIGTMEVVDNFKPDVLRNYYKKWYRPDLQGLVVVGDIEPDRIEASIHRLFGTIPAVKNGAIREYIPVPDNDKLLVASDKDKEQPQPVVLTLWKRPVPARETLASEVFLQDHFLQMAALYMLNNRFQEMALDPDVPFVSSGASDGDFLLAATTRAVTLGVMPKEGRVYEALRAVLAEVRRVQLHGFTATEFERFKAEFFSSLDSRFAERAQRENSQFTGSLVDYFLDAIPEPGIEYEHAFYHKYVPTVSEQQVHKAFLGMMPEGERNVVMLSANPDKENYEQPLADSLSAIFRASQQLQMSPYEDKMSAEPLLSQQPVRGSVVKEETGPLGSTLWTLSNGVRVNFLRTDFKENEVMMWAYSPGGTSRYPLADRFTTAHLGLLLQASGLGNYNSKELAKYMLGKQAQVQFSSALQNDYFEGNSTVTDLRYLFELVYANFLPRTPDEAAAESQLLSLRESLRNKHVNPMQAFQDSLDYTAYGHHPLAQPMTEAFVDSISYKRALQIQADRLADASDYTFFFVGNFNPDTLRNYAETYLAALPTQHRDNRAPKAGMKFVAGHTDNVFVRAMQQPQAWWVERRWGFCADNLRTRLLYSVLGQVLEMKNLEVVREQMGAAYSIATWGDTFYNEDDSLQYSISVYAPLKPETTDTVRQVVLQQLQQVADKGVEAKYLDKVKEYLLKTHRENERKNTAWMNYLTTRLRYGVDIYTDYEKQVESITSADLAKVARGVLQDNNVISVLMKPKM